jgi:hypothetical protein
MSDNEIELDYLLGNLNIHDNKEEKIWATIAKKRFETFYDEVREQPLSSFIRAMEIKCRRLQPVFPQGFEIRWRYMDADNGSCFLTEDAGIFVINLPFSLNEKEIEVRNLVAHEIGHLYSTVVSMEKEYFNETGELTGKPEVCLKFLRDRLNSENLEKEKVDTYHRRATMIGVFVLNERSKFYKHRMPLNSKAFCKSFRQIADDFKK